MRAVRNMLILLMLMNVSAGNGARDPFHLPDAPAAQQKKSVRYAGIVGDGRCWSQWWIDSDNLWRKAELERCASPLWPVFPPAAASSLRWCPKAELGGRYPFSCPS